MKIPPYNRSIFPGVVLFLAISLFIQCFMCNAARAGDTPVTVSDLDGIIRSLPRRQVVDRLSPLVSRLRVLDSSHIETSERDALVQAVALIKLMRTIRLSTAPARPTAWAPLVALR